MALDALEDLSGSHSVLDESIVVRRLQFRSGRRTVPQQDVVSTCSTSSMGTGPVVEKAGHQKEVKRRDRDRVVRDVKNQELALEADCLALSERTRLPRSTLCPSSTATVRNLSPQHC